MILNKSAVDRGMFRGHIFQVSKCFSPFLVTLEDISLTLIRI